MRTGGLSGDTADVLEVRPTGLAFRASYVPGLVADRARRRAEYAARARTLAAADDERRRVVRDLHDGAQQRLVHTVVLIKLAQQALERADGEVAGLLAEALDQALAATTELRELARGAVPPILRRGGLRAAARELAERSPVPVSVDVVAGRLPAVVEATAYFVIAEALTNVAKHARARTAGVDVALDGDALRVQVDDDGIGGADAGGSGLIGLAERVTALGGVLAVEAGPRGGTCIVATIPVLGHP
jgi:signal transduction histidine kinase